MKYIDYTRQVITYIAEECNLKSINARYPGTSNYLIKSLFVSIVAVSAFITFSYLANSDSDYTSISKSSKLLQSVEHSTYFLEAYSDNSDKIKKYNTKPDGLASLNHGIIRNVKLFNNSLSEFQLFENIYYIFSPLRSPPSV